MGNSITYPNGQTLTSTAWTAQQIQAIFQQTTCTALGITTGLAVTGTLIQGNSQITVSSVTGLGLGFSVTDVAASGYGVAGYGSVQYGGATLIPPNTVITDITGNIITLSNAPTGSSSGSATLYVTDPASNTAVRQSWQQTGAPAWLINEDVCFVRGVLENNAYTKIRDEGVTQNLDGSVTRVREYTRVWRIFWSAYGPNCFDNMRALQSALLLEVTTEPLSALNLYVVPDMDTPQYAPELDDGQWWQRTTFEAVFYEQVTETITTPSFASVQIITNSVAGQAASITIT